MDLQNLAYALTQVAHNFGAVAVTGGAVAALRLVPRRTSWPARALARLVALAWLLQAASGAAFGAISFYYYERFPDLSSIGTAALGVKVACAGAGFVLTALYLARGHRWSEESCRLAWRVLAGLGAGALTAAAFLRWYS